MNENYTPGKFVVNIQDSKPPTFLYSKDGVLFLRDPDCTIHEWKRGEMPDDAFHEFLIKYLTQYDRPS